MSAALDRINAEVADLFADFVTQQNGTARQQQWRCEDGWIVGYTTTRIEGGKHPGKFAAMAYKPVGAGANSGKAKQWSRVYFRVFAKRKTARAKAEEIYFAHCPKADARRTAVRS